MTEISPQVPPALGSVISNALQTVQRKIAAASMIGSYEHAYLLWKYKTPSQYVF